MIRINVFCKQAMFVTLAAASVLACSSASAAGVVFRHGSTLSITNKNPSATCARAYVNGQQYDLNAANPSALMSLLAPFQAALCIA